MCYWRLGYVIMVAGIQMKNVNCAVCHMDSTSLMQSLVTSFKHRTQHWSIWQARLKETLTLKLKNWGRVHLIFYNKQQGICLFRSSLFKDFRFSFNQNKNENILIQITFWCVLIRKEIPMYLKVQHFYISTPC